jgi:hypothetical protein
MAQSGYTPILIYGSGTPTNVPSASNLISSASGVELALNYADGKLYYKDSGGVVQVLASKAGNVNVASLSFGTTGLTPNTATTGAITVAGTLITSNGGTGLASYTAGDLPYYASGTALSKLAIGTSGQILTSSGTAPQWSTLSGVAVTTFQTSLSGLTPSTATAGAVTLAGTLGVASGGTGLVSLSSGYIPYGNGTGAFSSSSNLNYNGTGIGVNTTAVGSLTLQGVAGTNGINQGIGFLYSNGTQYGALGLNNSSGWPQLMARAGAGLTFHTNSDLLTTGEAMRITSAGYVGIGYTNPSTYLAVNGGVAIGGTSTLYAARLSLYQNTADAYGIVIQASSGDRWLRLGNDGTNAIIEATYNTSSGNGPLTFWTGSSERMRLDSSGNLLINATSNTVQAPKLYVAGTTSTLAMFGDAYSATVGDSRTILLGNTNAIIGIVESSTNIGMKFQTWSSGASVPLYLSGAGNVGIGTSSPVNYGVGYPNLTINGSITGVLDIQSNGVTQLELSTGTNYAQISAVGASGVLAFTTGGNTERMRLTSAGYLGIGTSSPSNTLTVQGTSSVTDGTNGYVKSYVDNTYGFVQSLNTAQNAYRPLNLMGSTITFSNNGVSNMLLDSSGNLGLGTIPSAWASGGYALQLASGNISANNTLYLSANNYYNGSNNKYISNGYAGYYSINNSNGQHEWYTAPSGSANGNISFTQAMTLDNSGNLLVGTTTSAGSNVNSFMALPQSGGCFTVTQHASGSASGFPYAYFNYNGSTIGSITQSGTTAVLFNVTSDQRLKTNIVDAPSGNIDQIKVRSFDFKSDNSHVEYGFIAQELIEVAPYAVHQPTNPDEMMGVDYSKLVPMMIKEIQDLKAEVNQLKQKIGV